MGDTEVPLSIMDQHWVVQGHRLLEYLLSGDVTTLAPRRCFSTYDERVRPVSTHNRKNASGERAPRATALSASFAQKPPDRVVLRQTDRAVEGVACFVCSSYPL
jgi:hypothetical protein